MQHQQVSKNAAVVLNGCDGSAEHTSRIRYTPMAKNEHLRLLVNKANALEEAIETQRRALLTGLGALDSIKERVLDLIQVICNEDTCNDDTKPN